MWKALLAGVVAIAALVAASMAVIVVVTRDEPVRVAAAPREGAPPSVAPEPAAPLPARPERPAGAPAGPARPPGAPVRAMPAPPPPPAAGTWEAVPLTSRARSMGRAGGAIAAKLTDLQEELASCFTYEGQARRGSGVVTTVQDAAPMDDHGAIVLVLQLEGQGNGYRIVDAPVETRGGAGDELLACAQSVLRGHVLEVPGAQPGQRYRLLHQLQP